ncbi:MAG: hypothetical protein AAB775_01745 [Patescibacteria group bacterium]
MRGSLGKVYQKKLRARKRKRVLFVCLYILLALGAVFSGLSFLSQADFMSVEKILVRGNERAKIETVEALVVRETAGNYFYFFSKKNTFLYPAGNVKEKILALPLIQFVKVERNGLKEIGINLEERMEDARWCEGDIHETDSCFSMDENGLIFDVVATSTAFIYRGLISGFPTGSPTTLPIGRNFLPPEEFKKVQFFMRELGSFGIAPTEAIFMEPNYMTVVLFAGGKLIVNINDDLTAVLSNISSVINDKTVAPSLSRFLQKLDYMKLDSGNKVVYKLK